MGIVETWSASGKFDRVQVCQNKVSMKKSGRWITAKRICIKFMSDAENKKKARIVEFAAGRMMKDEYKAQKKRLLGRGKTELPPNNNLRTVRNTCKVLDNFLTKKQLFMKKRKTEDKKKVEIAEIETTEPPTTTEAPTTTTTTVTSTTTTTTTTTTSPKPTTSTKRKLTDEEKKEKRKQAKKKKKKNKD